MEIHQNNTFSVTLFFSKTVIYSRVGKRRDFAFRYACACFYIYISIYTLMCELGLFAICSVTMFQSFVCMSFVPLLEPPLTASQINRKCTLFGFHLVAETFLDEFVPGKVLIWRNYWLIQFPPTFMYDFTSYVSPYLLQVIFHVYEVCRNQLAQVLSYNLPI